MHSDALIWTKSERPFPACPENLHLEEQVCAESNTFIEVWASTFSPIRQLRCFISAGAS